MKGLGDVKLTAGIAMVSVGSLIASDAIIAQFFPSLDNFIKIGLGLLIIFIAAYFNWVKN